MINQDSMESIEFAKNHIFVWFNDNQSIYIEADSFDCSEPIDPMVYFYKDKEAVAVVPRCNIKYILKEPKEEKPLINIPTIKLICGHCKGDNVEISPCNIESPQIVADILKHIDAEQAMYQIYCKDCSFKLIIPVPNAISTDPSAKDDLESSLRCLWDDASAKAKKPKTKTK